MAPAVSIETIRTRIVEASSLLESHRTRCSEILEAARRSPVSGDTELHCLGFLEKELSYIVAWLTALRPQHVDDEMMRWLERLTVEASENRRGALDTDPQRHTLLRRAARCFRRRHRDPYLLVHRSEIFQGLIEYRCRYKHLLTTISRGGLPHQAAEGGNGLLPAGIHYGITLQKLYISMFPYGHKFDKDQLVTKWLCEGIFNKSGMYPDILDNDKEAYRYFFYLVDKNVITYAAANSRHNYLNEAEVWQWNINHLVYRFLASKSAEIGFIFTSDTLNLAAAVTDHGNATSRMPRRLALHHDDPNIPCLLQTINLPQIRSLAVSGAVSGSVPLDKFVNLVVLDVQGWENFGDDDLLQVCISKMFFLVYLSIRNTRVSKLPPQMGELFRLKVLDASYTQVTELSLEMFKATRIRRLDLRGTPVRQVTGAKQVEWLRWWYLRTFLLGSEGMINSAETAARVPHDLCHLRFLETLATIDLSDQPASFVKALGDLDRLRVLAVTWSFHQSSDTNYCDALLSSIKAWCKLESLTIHCGLGCSMEFMGSLPGMSVYLETFKVTVGRFAGVPQWFRGLRFLSYVQLTICKLGARDLEILRDLPKLKRLVLGLDFIPKEAIVIKNEGFHELQRFSIDCPVPWLTFESGAMPKLTYLQLDFCACPTNPISVPLGISNLRRLTEVAVWYNVRYANSPSVKMTVEAVRKEVAKCRNTYQEISIFINGNEQDDVQALMSETGAPSGTNARAEDVIQAAHEITEE